MAHRFPVASLMALPTISQYRVSPAGERIAFVRDTTGGNELYVLDIKSETVTRVSDGELHDEHPGPVMWAPDGERIYFQRPPADDGIQTIDTVDMAGTVERVLAAEGTVHLEDVRPDGNALLLHFLDSGDEPLDRDLYRYDSTTGETVRLTEYDHPVRSRNLFSPEGNRISYQVYRIVEGQQQSDPYVVDADGTSPRQLAFGEENSDSRIVDWHPDGRRLLVMDDATGTYRSGVYDLDTDDVRWAGDAPFDVRPMAFRPDGGGFLARHYREVTTVPAVYTLDGEGRELPLDGGVADYPTWVKPHDDIFLSDGFVVLLYGTEARPSALVRYDFETGATATVVDADYGDLSPGVFTEAEYVTYDSEDGLEIGALLYRAPTTPSPAVVHVHGGPAARAERRFEPYGKYAQFFVSRGYTVLQPNYRGSTGRGAEFRRRIHGDWGGGDAADVAAAGEWLQSQAFVDADRVAVFGQSYGAYSVFVQLTKYPTLWTAGVAWNGRTEGGDRQYGPIDNAETVECPLLVLAGENDPRLDEMRRFRDALLERGWTEGEEFEYVELESEGHHSRDTDHQIRRFQHIEAFLDSRV